MKRIGGLLVIAVMAASLSGCGIPVDPAGTLDRVSGGELRVGVSHNPPWTDTSTSGNPTGLEVRLVEQFADDLDAEIVWTETSEARLMDGLERGELDLAIAGLLDDTPWMDVAAVTRPFAETRDADDRLERHVMATPMGENAFLVRLERFLSDQEVTP